MGKAAMSAAARLSAAADLAPPPGAVFCGPSAGSRASLLLEAIFVTALDRELQLVMARVVFLQVLSGSCPGALEPQSRCFVDVHVVPGDRDSSLPVAADDFARLVVPASES